jgi:hypothetical protein
VIIIRASGTSGGDSGLSTNLNVRYLFTSDAQDSVTGDSGTVTGGTATFGSDGYVSGGSLYIAMPTSFSEAMFWDTGDGTLSWWQTVTGNNTGNNYFLNDREGYALYVAGELGLGLFGNDGFKLLRGGSPTWEFPLVESRSSFSIGAGASQEHIVLVKDSSSNTLKLYVNGSLVNTSAFSDAFGNNDTNIWRLGSFSSDSRYVYDAKIADLAVWNGRALSSDEISTLYGLGQGGSY